MLTKFKYPHPVPDELIEYFHEDLLETYLKIFIGKYSVEHLLLYVDDQLEPAFHCYKYKDIMDDYDRYKEIISEKPFSKYFSIVSENQILKAKDFSMETLIKFNKFGNYKFKIPTGIYTSKDLYKFLSQLMFRVKLSSYLKVDLMNDNRLLDLSVELLNSYASKIDKSKIRIETYELIGILNQYRNFEPSTYCDLNIKTDKGKYNNFIERLEKIREETRKNDYFRKYTNLRIKLSFVKNEICNTLQNMDTVINESQYHFPYKFIKSFCNVYINSKLKVAKEFIVEYNKLVKEEKFSPQLIHYDFSSIYNETDHFFGYSFDSERSKWCERYETKWGNI